MPDVKGAFHDGAIPVVGEVIAGRSWRVWSDGALTGVTYGHEWKTSGNVAFCPYIGTTTTSKYTSVRHEEIPSPVDWRGGYDNTWYTHGRALTKKHRPGAMGCSCGFWVYGDMALSAEWQNVYRTFDAVAGIVRVYGVMTRGTKGFRAERADILAFVEPTWASSHDRRRGAEQSHAETWERVVDRYPTVPVRPTLSAAIRNHKGTL